MQKLSGKRNEFGRRSGEQLELYRRSNLSGKRTEGRQKTLLRRKYFLPAFLVPKMGNGHEKQADSEGGKNK
mgnify:CR=1 FL=1